MLGLTALVQESIEKNALFAVSRAKLQKRKFSKPIGEKKIILLVEFLMRDLISHGRNGVKSTMLFFATGEKQSKLQNIFKKKPPFIQHPKTIFGI